MVFPFNFFIAKEFFFILYDELKNKSISKKIDNLKEQESLKGNFNDLMVEKINDKEYILVR